MPAPTDNMAQKTYVTTLRAFFATGTLNEISGMKRKTMRIQTPPLFIRQ